MGMFDYIRSELALPDDPPAIQWQTKDTPSQYMDVYEIRADGSLWVEEYDLEDCGDPKAEGVMRLRGCMTPVNKRWVPCKLTGEIQFYGAEDSNWQRWWEFSSYFIDGQMQSITNISKPAIATADTDGGSA
jgi:hypothetical protein